MADNLSIDQGEKEEEVEIRRSWHTRRVGKASLVRSLLEGIKQALAVRVEIITFSLNMVRSASFVCYSFLSDSYFY